MTKPFKLISVLLAPICVLVIFILIGCSAEEPTEPTAADIEEAQEEKEAGGETEGEAETESGESDSEGGGEGGDN
ncbi:MAG: hypothetical protein QF406_13425 [Verrucomicrobiota bacterium]|jgi:hypothetical protein|nr:hypothetical protein [Verrucomicrobiota bacterium]